MNSEHHIVPIGDGSADKLSNTSYLCPNCHRSAQATATCDSLLDGGAHE
jgi:5-methylcytosine-specific restriction endonuclease McrA